MRRSAPLSALRGVVSLVALTVAVMASSAHAEDSNHAVAAAEDAFGTAVGHEQIGVYDENNVRGFNPGTAGNFRMEGMYFDIQGGLGNRIIGGEIIHVGPSAQGFAFPAPTGIVDLSLRKPGSKLTISPFFQTDSFGTASIEMDASIPLSGKDLGVQAGVGVSHNHFANGGHNHGLSVGAVPHWQVASGVELTAFANYQRFSDETPGPIFITNGSFQPPHLPRAKYLGPDWALATQSSTTFGLVGKAETGNWILRTGVFHSQFHQERGYSNLVFINPDNSSDRQIVAYPTNGAGSWSGEGRLSRIFREGEREHMLTAALRGRSIFARYGGGDAVNLPTSPLGTRLVTPEPSFAFGPVTKDHTDQTTFGLSYSLAWRGLGAFTAGLQRTHYIKRVEQPGLPVARGTSTATLPSLSATVPVSDKLAFYGSWVRGLEDAGAAPGYAANANQILPAIRTRQTDLGLRWAPVKGTTLILGWFRIAKPYIDIDQANRFGVLGSETHEGVEVSLTSKITPLLRVVTGGVWQNPRVEASPTIAQPVGRWPVGQNKLRTRFNIEWTLPFARALTLDSYLNYESSAAGTVDNLVISPGTARLGIGARYKFKLAGKDVTARAQLFNVFDSYFAVPFGSGVYGYNTKRNAQFWITTEF